MKHHLPYLKMNTQKPRNRDRRINPKVLISIGLGYGYGRGIIAGIVSYARTHGPWEFVGQLGPVVQVTAIEQAPRYDGIIFDPIAQGAVEAIKRRGAPAVSVGGAAVAKDIPHVTSNSKAVARMAFDYFRGLGFSRFATYGGNPAFRAFRIQAFADLAKDAGFSCFDLGPSSPQQWLVADKKNQWTREIHRLKTQLPQLQGRTALFAWSSEEARPIVAACDELGIDVPDHLAVLGVDDDEAICELASPPISAIDHGCETIGWQAAKALDAMMRGQPLPSLAIHVDPVRVVDRQSTQTLAVYDPILITAVKFIQDNFAEGITVRDVLSEVGVSRPTLENHFRHTFGRTAHQHITLKRIERAKELLLLTMLDLGSISVRCGFSYPSKFSAAFRRETGVSPTEFRRWGRASGSTKSTRDQTLDD